MDSRGLTGRTLSGGSREIYSSLTTGDDGQRFSNAPDVENYHGRRNSILSATPSTDTYLGKPGIAGRITVYTVSGCPFCRQVAAKLESLSLPMIELNLDIFAERRAELTRLSGKSSVPQIFFNDRHVGGYQELIALEESGELALLIQYVKTTPASSRAPALPSRPVSPSGSVDISMIGSDSEGLASSETDYFARLVKEIRKSQLVRDRTYRLRSYKACLVGSELVQWLITNKLMQREDAVGTGKALVKRHFLHHVCHDHDFKDEKLFYRFLDDEPTEALNTFTKCEHEPRPAEVLAEILRRQILSLYDLHLSRDGRSVDYEAMAKSEAFKAYSELACELQRCDLDTLDLRQRTAFFINIYNVLVMHATTQYDSPKTSWDRYKFFNSISYIIGGLEYSLSGIENGVLRANKRAPNQVHRPFPKGDPRCAICLPQCDPRVHFAIVCGAKSCPPIKVYSAEDLDEQLDVAVAAFLDDGGIIVDEEKHEIHLSRIFQWYQSDFAETKYELLKWIIKYMPPGNTCRKLFDMVRTLNYKIVFQAYDWASNAKE